MRGRTVRFDPHVHTAASYDATAPVEAVLDRAVEVGLDAVAITDHDTLSGARTALESGRDGLTVIPGVEVSTGDGHLLALGVAERPAPGRPLAATVETVRELGGAAVIPHPLQRSRHGVGRRALRDCDPDGIETYNAMAVTGIRNRRARRFARGAGYPKLGGSDAHAVATVGHAYTEVDLPATEPVTPDLIVSAVRAGETRVVGRRTPLRHCLSKFAHNVRLRTPAWPTRDDGAVR
ncbi:MAG: CehA/McbA family metallohydrolase [Salinirussus sp.]